MAAAAKPIRDRGASRAIPRFVARTFCRTGLATYASKSASAIAVGTRDTQRRKLVACVGPQRTRLMAKFVCAFRGRRDSYQVPLALAEGDLLDQFITDA